MKTPRQRLIAPEVWLILRNVGSRLIEIPSLLATLPFTVDHYTGFALTALLVAIEIIDERRSRSILAQLLDDAARGGLLFRHRPPESGRVDEFFSRHLKAILVAANGG